MKTKLKPPINGGVTDPRFKYIPAAHTDILAAFRAMGWVPPSQKRREVTA